MQCDRVGEILGAYLDQQLDAATRREVAAHLGYCAACSALAEDLQRMGRQVAALGREPAPETLVADVRSRLARAEAEPELPARFPALARLRPRTWMSQAAALVLVAGLSAATA